jgi:hypothetical protein
MVAAKLSDDLHYHNGFWAKIGGVTNAEMNSLEMKVMSLLGWSAHVPKHEFDRYRDALAALRGEGDAVAPMKGRRILSGMVAMRKQADAEGRIAVLAAHGMDVRGDDKLSCEPMHTEAVGQGRLVGATDGSPDRVMSVAA